jgi:peptidylprolyl isomerase
MNRRLAWLAGSLMLLAAISGLLGSGLAGAESKYKSMAQGQTADGFPRLGEAEAKITLVEFSNFSCPGCMEYEAEVAQIIETNVRTGQANFIMMPMIFGYDHPSYLAAQGALCAAKQNGFWDMHDALFQQHKEVGANSFTADTVKAAAAGLGLDAEAIATCMAATDTAQIVYKSLEVANNNAIQFTPTLMYSLDGGATLYWFYGTDGKRFDSRVPAADVARYVAQANAAQLTPVPTSAPTDPYADGPFVKYESADKVISFEHPAAWTVDLLNQGVPGYVVGPEGSGTTGISMIMLPIAQLGLPDTNVSMTSDALIRAIFPQGDPANIRAVKTANLTGVALKQTVPTQDPATGATMTLDRDFWLLIFPNENVLVIQGVSPVEDWPKMKPIFEKVMASLSLNAEAANTLLAAAFPPPPGLVPVVEGFIPVAIGEGKCVGIADPTDTTTPADGRGKQYEKPEQVLDTTKIYCAILTTEKGRIVIQLYPEIAPQHVNSFVFLAQQGFYDGVTWHRVIPEFVAQTGDPTGSGSGGPGYEVPLEISSQLTYDRQGVLGMARSSSPNSAGSQFFITYAPQQGLNPGVNGDGYSIFGQVVEGYEFVEAVSPRDPASAATAGDTLVSVRIVTLDK